MSIIFFRKFKLNFNTLTRSFVKIRNLNTKNNGFDDIKISPVDINVDLEENEVSQNLDDFHPTDSANENDVDARTGFYKSSGIKVHIPKKYMYAGTCRKNIKQLPKNVPDDIRIIYYPYKNNTEGE